MLAIAAIVVIAVAGFAVLRPSSDGFGGPSATESPPLTPSPSVSPAAVIQCEDDLPGCAGPRRGTHQSNQFDPEFTYETTTSNLGAWLNVVDIPGIYKIDQRNPTGQLRFGFSAAASVVLFAMIMAFTVASNRAGRAGEVAL